MSFWKKESKTVFVRNEAGKVIAVQHLGDEPKESRTPVSKALMKQHYEKHPEERPSAKAKKRIDGVVKAFDEYSLRYAKSHQGSRLSPSRGKPMPPLGSYSFANNPDPFGSTFDRGPRRIKTKKSSKKYTVIGGKAYLIAGTGKKKKKTKSKRRKYNPNDPFDFPDIF